MSKFKLYNSANVSLVYEFPIVQDHNADTMGEDDNKEYILLQNGIAKGSVAVSGGSKTEDLFIKGYFIADDYEAIKILIASLKSAIVYDTNYVLRVYYNESQYNSFNVKRLDKFDLPVENYQNGIQPYTVNFKTNMW